jgi:acetylcholinesterase
LEAGKFAHLPFIAGDVLDEGDDYPESLISTQHARCSGTAFVPSSTNSTEFIFESLVSNFSISGVATPALVGVINRILELYPDIPSLGSPYNTGNETFGLSSQFKRYAAICESRARFISH